MAYKEYDLKKLTVALGGALAQGFADGEFLTITPNRERNLTTIGADGEGARSKLYDKSYQITLTLLQTSSTNDILSAYSNANSSFTFSVLDASGTTVFSTLNCWIRQNPDVSFSNEITERAWTLECAEAEEFVGGN